MQKTVTQLFILTICCLLVNTGYAQLTATPSEDAVELIESFLNDNGNLTYSNATLTGADVAAGLYDGAEFGVSDGVILSTGNASDAAGPNASMAESTNHGLAGDADLELIAGVSTNDAVSLSADFVAEGSSISFSYTYASEDYHAYVCSPFADVVGVIVNGGEYENENIALVPSTDLFVSTSTINSGEVDDNIWEEDGCPEGGLDNSSFFVDNEGGLNHEFNGRSVVLDAQLDVTPGEMYNIKWVIADGGDALFDSALFLESGSLSSSEDECTAAGGTLTVDGPSPVCKSDGEDDIFNLSVEGATGENQVFVATFTDGEIILITNNTQLNLEGFPGNQACLFWHLSWDGEIEGAEVGLNAFDITGDCFDLSNSVEVIEYFTNGGEISTEDATTICALDGEEDPIDVSLEGAEGENMAWVITDADLNILDLPAGPPFDLEGAGEGLCIIWHLSWSGELEGAAVGENAGDLSGDCFDLSNPIEVTRYVADGGEISTEDETTICVGDGIGDPIDVTLTGETGESMAWVITDADLNILDLPAGPPFDLEGAGEGLCIIWHLSWSGDLEGAAVGENAGNLSGDCFDLSNPIEVIREECCTADGGTLTVDGPSPVCKSDGEDDIFTLSVDGAVGENQAFVATFTDGEIILITNNTQLNLEGFPGNQACLFWHLSWDGEIEGAEVGLNAFDITGDCFDLSNSVEVIEYFTNGGEISTEDATTICALDGEEDPIDVSLEGAEGENMAWVITDADLNILDLPAGPPFDLEGAGEGLCIIWHLSWSGELEGAAVGENAGDLSGDCFDLSNPIEVTRYVADGGEISTDDPTTICALDGEEDPINVTLTGEAGESMAWVITDADLNILDLPAGPPFDLEGAGEGLCIIWHLSWSGELNGAAVGENAGDLSGDCFDLSNPIEVTRYVADGGEISTDDPTTICALDGEEDPINVTLTGEAGESMAWVITDADLNILDLPAGPPFDLEGAGEGLCIIWHLSWSGELNGAAVGENAGDLSGDCFDLSNPIEVTRYVADGGEISTDDPTTICALDGEEDPINVTLTGEAGESMAWVITDAELNILDLPAGPPFDLDGAGVGVCLIWHLSWSGDIEGAAVGENAGNLSGDCFDLSNPIEVIREECCTADGGTLTVDGPSPVCKSDGEDDIFTLSVEGAVGENQVYVATFTDGEIILITENTQLDLEGFPGNQACLFWHLSWDGEIQGAEVGLNAFDITGDCFDLSNSVEVIEYFTNGGEISTDDPTTICALDGVADPIDVSLENAEGENMAWVITDAELNILDLPAGPPFDLEGAGEGLCIIWHLSWSGELNGAAVGENAGDLSGDCFDLSNPIEVTRYVADGGEISTDDPTTICALDGVADPIDVTLEGATGDNMAWVITDGDLNILDLPMGPPFDLEGAGEGLCIIWHLSWSGELEGAMLGANAGDLSGDCFDLSNPIEVTRYVADGGEISTEDPTTICSLDGVADPIDVTLEGSTGDNMAWVITDGDLNILELPMGPPFDLEGAGEGLCIIWHLSWSGELEGAMVGANAGDLSGGCFDLSNPIEVTRYVADGGEISTDDPTTICALDGVADPIDVTLEGATGDNMAWVITDGDLNILDLPMGPPFDLEGAGEGLCIIWHLSWSGELEGAMVGANAGDLSGDCFDLSNPIEVTRYAADGGEISTEDPTTICALDGVADPIDVTLEGATGDNMAWVITDGDLNILELPMGPPFDLEGAGEGLCIIWHLSWSGELNGAAVGENAGDISGDCFDLSNPIEVTRYVADGGEISTDDETTICVGDGIGDPIDVTLTGETGENMAWVITDADLNILDLPMSPPFDLDGAGVGVCLIWHLSWSGDLEGAMIGANAGDLSGDCFDLSNPIEVTREECDDCTAVGGELTVDGPTTVCKSDGVDDNFTLVVTGNEGENQAYVVTWLDGEIILISDDPEFNLEGIPGNGTCLFWSLSWDGEIEGAEVGLNANDLLGDCFELSNPVPVTEYFTDGGEISTNDDTTICVGDGIADPINVTLVGDQGQNMAWVITDADLNILDLPAGPQFDLEGAGTGTCLIWNLSWSGDLEGAMVGENAGNLSGDCFDLSNSIAVERIACVPLVAPNWEYELSMAPNPTDGIARVSYTSNQDAQTSISIYNLNGQRVEVLLDQNTESGVKYMLPFDGNSLPSGIYMYQISNGKEVKMQKFVIAR